jgi:hypothetical protein
MRSHSLVEKRSKPPEISSGILELLLWVVVPGERMKMTGILDLGSAFLTASKFLHVKYRRYDMVRVWVRVKVRVKVRGFRIRGEGSGLGFGLRVRGSGQV